MLIRPDSQNDLPDIARTARARQVTAAARAEPLA